MNESDREVLERAEERLVADVRTSERGRVHLRKHVVEEPEQLDVTLRHDEVDVERRPLDRPLDPSEQLVRTDADETVVLVVEERLEVQRVPWVVEEVRLRRRTVTNQQPVTDTVRRERVEISSEGEVDLKHP